MRYKFKNYLPVLTASSDGRKGVLDVDTVKGCELGMKAHPNGGCYGLCYACKTAELYGIDFRKSVSRKALNGDRAKIFAKVSEHPMNWFRIGTMGDPSHDWANTIEVCEWLGKIKTAVIVTKHWLTLSDSDLQRLSILPVVFNTSISALDSMDEIAHRLKHFNRLKAAGIKSVLRIVSCKFGNTPEGKKLTALQESLFEMIQ